ncbi:hypothetical protein T265_08138 [Opisthorchis viverrini]|uniref:Uncharacterized protein n=1 Tax=Opisthorchis viverrini TaxID=6198 RepID=A0A074ZAP5_OPIVI|nr:hypothetical protein T265_08138 [Opisthorchis viverrini]KER24153.1 hypothetical protein T265_08138 [Opisthorchis viverrini]
MDFQILYGVYVRPPLEYGSQVVHSGRTNDVTLIERVQLAATRMVAGLKSVDYETRLAMLGPFPLEYLCIWPLNNLQNGVHVAGMRKIFAFYYGCIVLGIEETLVPWASAPGRLAKLEPNESSPITTCHFSPSLASKANFNCFAISSKRCVLLLKLLANLTIKFKASEDRYVSFSPALSAAYSISMRSTVRSVPFTSACLRSSTFGLKPTGRP